MDHDEEFARSKGARPDESRRDPEELKTSIGDWLSARPGLTEVGVCTVQVPESNGMSSETVLVDAVWTEGGEQRRSELVFRIAPDSSAVPVFENYDLSSQFNVMRDVARYSDVPVPAVVWLEEDPGPVGSPFFVMERAQGSVPPDVLPYNFGDNFLFDASPEQQLCLTESSVDVLVKLHGIADPESRFGYLPGAEVVGSVDPSDAGDATLRSHVDRTRRYYEWVVSDDHPSPLLERAFSWLDENWPSEVGPPVLCWGDARIGNMMFRDFRPVAVLDWEMASVAPREVDVSWMIFLHQFFEDVAHTMELPGMPDFMSREQVARLYEQGSGVAPANLDFYIVYSAMQHGIIMSQVQRRAIRFGAAEMPEDVDDMIMHRRLLEEMIS